MRIYSKLLLLMGILSLGYALSSTTAYAGGGATYAQPDISTPAYTNTPSGSSSRGATTPLPGANNTGAAAVPAAPYVVAQFPVSGLYKLADNPTVFAFMSGKLHPITSEAAFKAWGFSWTNIRIISGQMFLQMQVGENIGIPDGSLVKVSSSDTLYVVFAGHKNAVDANISLPRLGLFARHAVTISVSDLAAIPDGPYVRNIVP